MWPLALSDFAQGPTEYDVKAAFLLNFTKFIEWPESAFESASAPFRICIAGEDPFGDALDKMMQGESVGRHRLEVRRIRRSVTSGCQIVFYSREDKNVAESISHDGPNILTVGESDGFLREGGAIRFVLDRNRVRFDINQAAARKAGLNVSSKLLNVARSVEAQ